MVKQAKPFPVEEEAKPHLSDEAVRAATGKTWDEWFAELDGAGAAEMSHKEIVGYLSERYEISGWWEQSVAVAYEKARGLREKHQKADGYSVSASKTVPVGVDELFRAWEDEELRARWLGEPFAVRKATPSKSLRVTWNDGTHVNVYFYPKGGEKSQVAVEHGKLPDRESAERRKTFWKEALSRLESALKA